MFWSLLEIEEWSSVAQCWDNIASHSQHPLQKAIFQSLAVEFLASGAQIYIAVETVQSEVRSIMLLQPVSKTTWRSFSPSQLTLTTMISRAEALGDESISDLFKVLPTLVQRLEIMHVDNVYLPVFKGSLVDVVPYAPTMAVSEVASFNEYWKTRSAKLRNNIKRYQSRLQKKYGEYECRYIRESDEIVNAVTRYGELESSGWKGRQGTALHASNRQGKFYIELLRQFSMEGGALVVELWVGKELIASRLAVQGSGMAISLKTSYKESFAKYAPGRLLLYVTIRYFLEERLATRIEFYTKANKDQLAWATESRDICHYNIYRNLAAKYAYLLLKRLVSLILSK